MLIVHYIQRAADPECSRFSLCSRYDTHTLLDATCLEMVRFLSARRLQ